MNKRQTFTILLSVLLSVFLVAGAVYAVTTISGTTITLENSATITNPSAGRVNIGGMTSSGGGRGLYLENIATGAAVDLKGGMFTATGSTAATSGTIKGLEGKARACPWQSGGSGGGILGEVTAFYGSADAKQATVTTLRGMELSLDAEAGATITTAVGLRVANNMSATPTNTYGIEIGGPAAYTADILLSDTSTIAAGVISGTTLRAIVITPKASATTTAISYHELVRIPMTFGDPDHRTYGLVLSGSRSGAANAGFDGTDTSLDIRMSNDEVNNAAYDMQGAYIKVRNSTGGTVGNMTGMKIELDSRVGSTVTNITALEVYTSQDSASVSGNVIGIRIWDDIQDSTGTNYGLLINTSGGYSKTREYGIFLDSDSGSWTNAFSLNGSITNVLDFENDNGTNGADVSASIATSTTNADGAIKVDIGGTSYFIPVYTAGNTSGSW